MPVAPLPVDLGLNHCAHAGRRGSLRERVQDCRRLTLHRRQHGDNRAVAVHQAAGIARLAAAALSRPAPGRGPGGIPVQDGRSAFRSGTMPQASAMSS